MKRDASPGPLLFDDVMLLKADASDPLRGPRDEPDDAKLSEKLKEVVAEMIVAARLSILTVHGAGYFILNLVAHFSHNTQPRRNYQR
jgi:hypothetical protein